MTARAQLGQRLAGAFVLGTLAICCVGWWIGIPVLTLWGLAQVTDDGTTHFVGGLLGVPAMMALTAPILLWLNALYLRVTGTLARAEADEAEAGWRRQLRGPLEPLLLASLCVAFSALTVWFVFFAENPTRSFW